MDDNADGPADMPDCSSVPGICPDPGIDAGGGGPGGSGGCAAVGQLGISDIGGSGGNNPIACPPFIDDPGVMPSGMAIGGGGGSRTGLWVGDAFVDDRMRSSSLPWANWHLRPYGHAPVVAHVVHRTVL